jgi:hypothetical protein
MAVKGTPSWLGDQNARTGLTLLLEHGPGETAPSRLTTAPADVTGASSAAPPDDQEIRPQCRRPEPRTRIASVLVRRGWLRTGRSFDELGNPTTY